MRISISNQSENEVHVELSGDFDAEGCREIRDNLELAVDCCSGGVMLLDLYKVDFIDSSGIGAMVFLFKRLRAVDGSLKIINVRGQPQELISLLRVEEAIPVEFLKKSDNTHVKSMC